MIRAVVFEDEPMAAQHLATLLDDLPKRRPIQSFATGLSENSVFKTV
jgi:hypothetical protein